MNHEEDIRFGRLALDRGFITLDQLQEGMKSVKERPGYNLEFILISLGYITSEQAKTLKQFLSQQNRLGDYKILAKIGEGGMGLVYKALHLQTQQLRALKILGSQSSKNIKDIERFIREARTTSQLNHPNIVRLFEAKKHKDTYYLALEFVDGANLEALIREKGSLSEREALEICRQVALALQAAHEKKIVHRDIKPENILFNREGKVKLTDFGLAKAMDSTNITQTGYMVGTPSFVSPEQALGKKKIDIRSDIYSLGITLFYMVTGQTPYEDPSAVVVCQKHMFEPLPNPRRIKPELSIGLHKLLNLMTSKKPADRPQDPEKLIESFDALLEGREKEVGSDHTTIKISKRLMRRKKGAFQTDEILPEKRRIPWPLIGGVVALLFALATLGWFLWGLQEGRKKGNPPEKTGGPSPTRGTSAAGSPIPGLSAPFVQKLNLAIRKYREKGKGQKIGPGSAHLLPASTGEEKIVKAGLGSFFKMAALFENSSNLLRLPQKTLDHWHREFQPLLALWKNWKGPEVPQEIRDFAEEIQGIEHLYQIEKRRSLGEITRSLDWANQYESDFSKTLLFARTRSTTHRRFRVYRLYAEFYKLLKTLNMDPRTKPYRKMTLQMIDLLQICFEMLKDKKLSSDEVLNKLRRDYLKDMDMLVEILDRQGGPEPVLGSLCWLMLNWVENSYLLSQSGAYDTMVDIFRSRRCVEIKVPQGMDGLSSDLQLLLPQIHLFEYLYQRPQSDMALMVISLLSRQLAHRAEERKSANFLKPLFCYFPLEKVKISLEKAKGQMAGVPTKKPFSLSYDLPKEMGFFLVHRGDLKVQKLHFRRDARHFVQEGIFFSGERYLLPLEKAVPGRLKTFKLYLEMGNFSECALQLDHYRILRIFKNRERIFGRVESGPLKNLSSPPPSSPESYKFDNPKIALILKVGKELTLCVKNWTLAGPTKKDLIEEGLNFQLVKIPIEFFQEISHQTVKVYLKNTTLAFVQEEWETSKKNLAEGVESFLKVLRGL